MELKGKKVLVTGADGFIGSHLTEQLVAEGCEVSALAYYNSFNTWGWLDHSPVRHSIQVVTGDVRDPFFCKELVKEADIVFHLAALIGIPYSYTAPHSYVDTNIKGTLNICQACLEHKTKRLIHTSTSEVYGSALYVPIDEKHPLQPQSPYSATKIGADAIAMSYYYSFNLPVVIARPFNTYGPRQSARAVIPSIITQIAKGISEISLGDTTPTRDFNYVADTVSALIALAKCDAATGRTVNLGSGTEISINELFNTIRRLMNSNVVLKQDIARIRPENSEVRRLKCDNTLLKELTGYSHRYDLEAGLKLTIGWFSDPRNNDYYKADIYNV